MWLVLARLTKVLAPFVILGLAWRNSEASFDSWSTFNYLALAFALAIYFTVVLRGRMRDVAVVAASALAGLAGLEAYSVLTLARPFEYQSAGYSGLRPILGWGPQHPGVFHHVKRAAGTRRVIFDVNYTIDADRNRKVIAAETGPAVAFFGDSFTFGTGVPDSQTLPQKFADLYGRKLGVWDFGFPGYGPQQFLRALETNLFDPLLHDRVRLVIFEATIYLAKRAACGTGFMLSAPRYEMVGGHPQYRGACYQDWSMLGQLLANTSLYRAFVEPAFGGPTREDVTLFIGILAQAAKLARERYGVPTLIVYIRTDGNYLRRRSGYTEQDVIRRMQEAGLDVLDMTLDPEDFPGEPLSIAGDGHPTPLANAAYAAQIKAYLGQTYPDLLVER